MSQLKVIFVDDDMLLLKALHRLAMRLRPDWVFVLCDQPKRWLEYGGAGAAMSADIVVSDYVMPGILGNQILQQASHKLPMAIRVLLTADCSSEVVQQLESYSHFVFAKPYREQDLAHLFKCAERLQKLPFTLEDRQRVGRINQLPVMPQLIMQLRQVLADPDSDLSDCAELVVHDPVVSGKLIQSANSAMLGFSRQTSSLQEAITRLGAKLTEAIITTLLISEDIKQRLPACVHHHINNQAFIHANYCRRIAQYAGMSLAQRDTVFSAALLSAIGQLMLETLQQNAAAELPESRSDFEDATLLSAYILTLWGYPEAFCQTLMMQDLPTNEDSEQGKMAFMLFLAKRLMLDGASAASVLQAMIESKDVADGFAKLCQELGY
ncbi:HDOD domain-containing protein [Shewanella yunxiaonensis]|uniref:HDOD domain-containing protein n=1 Tax=Shewanella yunxiaonensis TaxID=2829809 RepID=A0ABX7YT24_9GAMM|nr:HDOD domain-containing protein [Shewanella yunxiaonensis]QUN05479.1 HDOD domain-containing protein [Shewanella yunxiaonensis]